ncbi:DUF1801 domain-containing protein [Micromonospora robiginosa]|uniref:DUF1801 domain-containing protein n=1 Tax=Micromonospora robiginosa TaxID=2749844 RepID=A0A7L6B3Q6_9ACTN|nr:DUF1801 domain-containing protein [Micromonospora ferruginea]QLQ36461.1 DUF1801 domain-containing protein [Micromonospora ferruginea]
MTRAKGPVTVPVDTNVDDFLATVPDARRRADAQRLRVVLAEVSGEPPVMWGPNIVGFGSHRGPTGDFFLVGFSPRKQNLVLYLAGGYAERHAETLARLGPHRTAKACLYLTRLDAVDEGVLRELVDASVRERRGTDRA